MVVDGDGDGDVLDGTGKRPRSTLPSADGSCRPAKATHMRPSEHVAVAVAVNVADHDHDRDNDNDNDKCTTNVQNLRAAR